MNALSYRLVFNRTRGAFMAVAECAPARSKTPQGKRLATRSVPSGPALARLPPAAFAVLLALGAQITSIPQAHAQIVAYKAAPASQRPTILSAGNGVPLVNIQTPSAAGVSRNTYEQFDVATQGAILNNSRGNAQTQLGGWVQGNPWLAAGTARVILNEVVSANPSQLLGYIEVAGSPAQVVIANPAGVTCNGCGFINASRCTLTTGTPVLNSGNLDGYRVEGGKIRIEGSGMDASQTGYTDLIARAVEINAGLWAQTLNVTTGSNLVSADSSQGTSIPGSGAAPAFAIDVAQLGGMYAGKITLVGTEAGVGVRNAGQIGAGIGDLAVTVDGQLINTGLINGGNTRLAATTLDNLGTGRIYGDHLAISATTLNNIDVATNAPVIAARDRLDLGVGTLNNRNNDASTADESATRIFSSGDLAIGGGLDANNRATGTATLVHNHGATIEALGDLSIVATDIRNTNAGFVVETVPESSVLIQEVQPEGWGARYDVSFFPTIFNYGVESQAYVVDGAVIGRFEDYTFYQYTASTSVTQLVSSRAGRIIAGGNATFAGNLENDDSRVLAGGTLTHTGGTLNNIATPGVRTTTYSGWAQFRDWDGRDEELEFGPQYPFSPAPNVTHFDLGIARYNNHAAPATGATPDGLGSLFTLNPTASYLIETDPQFAGYRQWLSSDYMLLQLAADPATKQKRLGDGFYEQRLITEQVAQLTGRRFLDGYANDEAQYLALMNAGMTYAQDWQLVPGIALTADQVARLTSDMVWLVEKEVALPDGSLQKVLVPQLYARLREGDLTPAGGLLSAAKIDIAVSGDINNRGSIAGRQLVSLTADNLRNLGGSVTGAEIEVTAGNDIEMRGGTLAADSRLELLAGRNIDIASATRSSQHQEGRGEFSRTNIERVAALYVGNANGQLKLAAAGDTSLLGAQLQSAGSTRIDAGGDLILGTVNVAEKNHTGEGKNHNLSGASSEVGTRIDSQGNIALLAGNSLRARAAEVTSQTGSVAAQATDMVIEAGTADSYSDIAQQSTRKGILSSKTKAQRDAFEDSNALASTFSGEAVTLAANRDLLVKGSNIAATQDATLVAGRDLTIEAATETHAETHVTQFKKSGIFSSGSFGVTLGSMQNSTDQQVDSTTAAKSTIGSVEGNVTLLAGEKYRQVGSDVIAVQGDIDIAAKTVDIVEARETSQSVTKTMSKQSGLTLAITGAVVSAIQTAQQMSQAAKDTKDGRMQALAAASTGLAAYNAAQAVKSGQGSTIDGKPNQMPVTDDAGKVVGTRDATAAEQMGGVSLVLSIGASKSSSKTTQTSDSAAVSNLTAGRDITITARGAGEASDITLQGVQANAASNLTLAAEDEIKLLAARNTANQKSSNQNASGSIGISLGTNTGITVGASVGRGKADGDDLSHTNTRLQAGDTLTLQSGGDTTLRGAVAKAEQVVAEIGGDLNIESLQDTSTFDSKQKSLGGSITFGVGVSGSVSASSSKVNSDYASVVDQSGIRAGNGGFQVNVQGDTELKGGAITSTQKALDDNKNRFQTGGELTLSNIENKAEYEGKSAGINLGAGQNATGKFMPQGTSAGFGEDSGNASSTTLAAISGIAGNTSARTGDPESGIGQIFDQEKVQKEIDAQVRITQVFGQLASKAVGDYADSKLKEAQKLREQGREQEATDLENQWGANGSLRLAAHTVIGGLTGGTSGAAGAATGTLTAPAVADALAEAGVDGPLVTALTTIASTAAGAAVGGTVGAGTALNEVANNYLSHPENKERAEARKHCASGNDSACQRADELDALDRQRDMEFHAACDGALRVTEGCADATRLMLDSVATYFPKQDGKIYLPDDFLKTAHQDELQSYRDLLQAANDKALQNDTASQRPDLYNSDLYGVVDPNGHDLYVMVKIGDQWNVVSKTDKVFSSEAGVNGILNDSDYAPGLLGYHIDKEQERQKLEKPGIYTLFYNPTGGFLADGLETLQDKLSFLFGPSEVAKKLSGVLGAIQQDGKSVNWVAHSQGGAIFVSAVDYHGGTLSKNSVTFHAGANNKLVTDYILKNAGMNFDNKAKYQENYWNSPNDAVPNIIGLNTINPVTWVRSILFVPALFMGPEWSPHTLPPKSNP